MGIDFTALLDHSLSWDELYRLPELLEARFICPAAALRVDPDLAASPGPWRWDRDRRYSSVAEELSEEGYLSLDGPGGFSATVFRTCVELTHLARWWSFAFDPHVRDGLREASRALATVLRSTTILYAPDSFHPTAGGSDLLFDGASFGDVLRWFAERIGPSVSSPDALAGADEETNEMGYLIEHVSG
ncbi:MAG TPA: hypothetical protein VL242_20760 [Sorangium sp.]|uniref:hypothetical protein n=1 Tax=Sorangium sp. So ce388 TaxID=3133309 RepID=UPI002C56285E|nr:hypothetical protein [Sorangium sp.]